MAWERVPYAEHPDRCQANRGNQGQCWNLRLGISKYCAAHGGNRANQEAQKLEKDEYLANSFLSRAKQIEKEPGLLSLTKEVALLKEILHQKTKLVKDEHSFVMHSGPLADLILKINTCVLNCTKLQEKLGLVLTAQQAASFANDILEVIAEEVTDAETLERIQTRILASLDQLQIR